MNIQTLSPRPLSPRLADTACYKQRFAKISASIGNTPLIALRLSYQGRETQIFAKAEMYNLSGSIKDRMALNIMQRAYESGELQPGQPIAEATSGNAGIAVAAIGSALGHPVTIFMPDWMSAERRHLLASYGADVRLVSAQEGGFLGSIAAAEKLGEAGYFLPRQFCNEHNVQAHEQNTLPELWAQMQALGARPTGFVAGVGTGGTVMGAQRFLHRQDPQIKVHPVEPFSSPTLSTGYKTGSHRIQGISDEFIPEIVKLKELDPVIAVHDGDAILMAQRMSRELGLGVGISSGANIIASLMAAHMQGGSPQIGTVLCDNHMKYLSTDLMKTETVKSNYYTKDVEFLSVDIHRCSQA